VFGVNAQYLLDALGAMPAKCESVKFEFVDTLAPCVITPNNEDAKATHVVMPMRV
jgi:DNA polymerase III sliding clamp (beta) subunit (PCNA family)